MNIRHRVYDDSYVITKNNLPYHVPNEGEYAKEWAEVHAYAKAHPECVTEEQPYVPPVPTTEELAASIRSERDRRIAATDYLLMVDYPLPEEDLVSIKEYRQALRDVPNQPLFPVDIEWPDLPRFLDKRGL